MGTQFILLCGMLGIAFSLQAQVMETFGDSVTAGTLSKTAVTETTYKSIQAIRSDLAKYVMLGKESYLTKYGSHENAWPAKLQQLIGVGNVNELHNYAVPRAVTADLLKHVKGASKTTHETMAFFFMGHNDICDSGLTPEQQAEKFVREYKTALLEWDKSRENSVAYIMDVGELHEMISTLNGYVWQKDTDKSYTCNDTWENFIPFCPAYSKLAKANKINEVVGKQIAAMNGSIDALIQDLNKSGVKNTFKHVKFWDTFHPEYSASDCFHLSQKGQQSLAEHVYKAIN